VFNDEDTTHGAGLNMGVKEAKGDHILILDVDCHFIGTGWEMLFRKALNESYHCITVAGSVAKPIRPACLFMQTQHAKLYDWRATPGYQGHRITPDGFDVGIRAYHEMVEKKKPIYWMEKGEMGLSRYETLTGEEYGLYNKPLVYHHWHGTHLKKRNEVDYVEHDLMGEKDKLFKKIPWRKKAKMV
jgi:glycosyltransferase involved in cell wall biosynthesis